MKPPVQRIHSLRSRTISQTVESGTSSPRRMYSSAALIAGDWSQSGRLPAARKTSPVERWQAPRRSVRSSACVPLPTPGAPRRIRRQGFLRSAGTAEHLIEASFEASGEGPCSHSTRSFLIVVPMLGSLLSCAPLAVTRVTSEDCDWLAFVLQPPGRLPSPDRAQGVEYEGVSRGQFAGVGDNLIGVIDNWIARDTPRLMSDDAGAVLTCC